MVIEYKENLAIFRGVVTKEDVEGLHDWLQNKSAAKIDLEVCSHLHPASLPVLMAAKSRIDFWPTVLSSLAAYSGMARIGDGSELMVRNMKEAA